MNPPFFPIRLPNVLRTFQMLVALLLLLPFSLFPQSPPTGLRVDLIEHSDRVFIHGELSQLSLWEVESIIEPVQTAAVTNTRPVFSWEMGDTRPGIRQTAFQLQVDTAAFADGRSPLWDSGKRLTSRQQVAYGGSPLSPQTTYAYRVRLWNNRGESTPWSQPKAFRTGAELTPGGLATYPLQQMDEFVLLEKDIRPGLRFYDFGKAAFGRLKLTAATRSEDDTLIVRLGEVVTRHGRLDPEPGGSRRFREVKLPLRQGRHTYTLAIQKDARNTRPGAILMPDYIGDVYPFRYAEVEGEATVLQLSRETVIYPFDDLSSDFECADLVLNDIWDFCKYSIKATSFAGLYVDGDRERIPYEADAYINQLCHYGVEAEYTLARKTQSYLLFHPTWPTEWILSTVLMAWEDYLYTGNADFIARHYDDLQAKSLRSLTETNGLISTRTGKLTDSVLQSIHFEGGRLRDIVDWPHKGILGLSGDDSGETDGFVFTDYNAVVNAYHNRALQVMAKIAAALDKEADAAAYAAQAVAHREAFNRAFLDPEKGYYTDGIGTDHSSLHANMFALAFGLVPAERVATVTAFVQSRGMACSVYGSQHLLDAVYAGEEAAYGLSLLTSETDRGWAHAIYEVGTTISLEAWDNKYKPNQDWNHAWGAAPANIIPMRLMGVKPTRPGFATFQVKPQPADLAWARLRYPTIRGEIGVAFEQTPGERFALALTVPPNSEAEVWIPWAGASPRLMVNEQPAEYRRVRGFLVVAGVTPGGWRFVVE